jgi:hypothetical protein
MSLVDVLGFMSTKAFTWFGARLDNQSTQVPVGLALILIGLLLIFASLRQVVRSIMNAVNPEMEGKLADMVYKRRHLAQGQRIVVIGGGTGLSTMLRGLKQYSSNIVAVVTVTDDGGSSGRLQREMGMLPPGDIRNCLVALADAEYLMTELDFLFEKGTGEFAFTGYSDDGGKLGNENLKGDSKVVLKATGDRNTSPTYLVGSVSDVYTGTSWEKSKKDYIESTEDFQLDFIELMYALSRQDTAVLDSEYFVKYRMMNFKYQIHVKL